MIKTSPYIGEQYQSSDMKLFTVKDLTVEEDDAWVEYTNAEGQEYTCRLEAFRARFTPMSL